MIRRQLSNYALSSIRLNNYKSYFKFILMLAGDINSPGPITTVDKNKMWDDLPSRNCNISVDWNDFDSDISNSGNKRVCLRIGECILFI